MFTLRSAFRRPQQNGSIPKATARNFSRHMEEKEKIRGFRRTKPLNLWNAARLLLRTNRKLHMRFRSVPKSTTLDDLEWSLLYTLFQNTCAVVLLRVSKVKSFPPQHSLVLINRPRRDGTLSWRWYIAAVGGGVGGEPATSRSQVRHRTT